MAVLIKPPFQTSAVNLILIAIFNINHNQTYDP